MKNYVDHNTSVGFAFLNRTWEKPLVKERLVGIFIAYAVFHHMVSCWIGSVSSFDSLANVCHVSQVFTACHKVVIQMKGRHCCCH